MGDAAVKITIKKTGRFKGPNLSDPQLKNIGDEMVDAQKDRWAAGVNASGDTALKLSVKYAIIKGQYLRKVGDPRGRRRVMRDMNMTGLMVKNFTLRKAANSSIRAENTSRAARQHAGRGNSYDQMIGFAGSDISTIVRVAREEYGEHLQKMWIPYGGR